MVLRPNGNAGAAMISKPKVKENWKAILWRSHSVRLNAAAGALMVMFNAWPTLGNDIWSAIGLSAIVPAFYGKWVPVVLLIASIIARPIVQKKLSGDQ